MSRVKRVYLAGPPHADEYRRRAEALVRRIGWEPVDPMRRSAVQALSAGWQS